MASAAFVGKSRAQDWRHTPARAVSSPDRARYRQRIIDDAAESIKGRDVAPARAASWR